MLLGLPDFDMVSAESVAEACALLARHDGKARLFAGGTDLLIMMKHRKATPRQLINIKRIAGLLALRRCLGMQNHANPG